MPEILLAYLSALCLFLALDILWIRVIAQNFYRRTIGHLLRDNVKMLPALIFYVCYVAILFYLVITAHSAENGIVHVAIGGALFGIIGYGTYDITNYALIKGWPLSVTIIDLIWGAFVTSVTSIVGFLLI
jgi:uncharacterized membrane protein